MKKFISILILVLICFSCAQFDSSIYPYHDEVMAAIEGEVFVDAYNLSLWIDRNFERIPDENVSIMEDEWQSPVETVRKGGGDCEDFAILFLYLQHELGFFTGELQALDLRDPWPNHMVATREFMQLYSPTMDYFVRESGENPLEGSYVYWTWDYDSAMLKATNDGTK